MADSEKITLKGEPEEVTLTEEELEDIRVTLDLDDGETLECKILTIFEVEETNYIALIPLDEDDEENEEGNIYIYRYMEDEDGNPYLDNIEDPEECEMVEATFAEWIDGQDLDEI